VHRTPRPAVAGQDAHGDDDVGNSYGATVDATYWLAVEDGDGTRALRRLPPVDEHPWRVTLDTPPSRVAAVAIVDNGGTVCCTARFR
jgi:hypothetical protein